MIKFKKLLFMSSVCLFSLGNPFCYADQTQMQETLRRIHHLLAQINPLINLAQSQQDNNMRIQFQFEHLRQDIASVEAGIDQALRGVTIQPRLVDPLLGDYLPEDQQNENNQYTQALSTEKELP